MRLRLPPLAALILGAAFALAAEDKPAVSYKSPEDAYAAFVKAFFADDHKTAIEAYTRRGRMERLVFMLGRTNGFERYILTASAGSPPKGFPELKPEEAKRYEAVKRALEDAGFTEKGVKEYVAKRPNWDNESPEPLVEAMVKGDPAKAYIALGKANDIGMRPGPKRELRDDATKLKNVEITGDTATAEPALGGPGVLRFVKTSGGWLIDGTAPPPTVPEPDKSGVNKTPQAAVDALTYWAGKGDHAKYAACFGGEMIKRMAGSCLRRDIGIQQYIQEAAKDSDAKPKKYAEGLAKALDAHGLTAAAINAYAKKAGGGRVDLEKLVVTTVKDHAAFFAAVMTEFDKQEPRRPDRPGRPRTVLADVKIDGDKATGKLDQGGGVATVTFEKIGGSWKVVKVVAPSEVKPVPKEKFPPKEKDKD